MQNNIKSTTNKFLTKLAFLSKIYNRLREFFDKALNSLAKILKKLKLSANLITVVGFIIGIFSINFLSFEYYYHALVCILLNRFFDMLDGAVARLTKTTKFGIFMDTFFDYVFYSAVIFGFALARPENALYASFMLFGFASVSCSMLAYATMDYKSLNNNKSKKKPFYLTGIIQGGEIFAALVMGCLLPSLFPIIAIITGVFCFIKALSMVIAAYYNFVVQEDNE